MIRISLLLFACAAQPSDGYDVLPTGIESAQNVRQTVDVCVVLEEQTSQDHLVFLYKVEKRGVEAQVELIITRQDPLMRCRTLTLALPKKRDGIRIDMDWMPRGAPVKIREMRIFTRTPHGPDDPYAVARYEPAPFQDYIFFVNLVTPALKDSSTIYLSPTL